MAKSKELRDGIATFSGYVDQMTHVGENDFGRTGDWIDVAVYGGVIRVPALVAVNEDDQVIVRGVLRNRGRVIDFHASDIVVCHNDDQLSAWENALNGHYRLTCRVNIGVYDRPTMVNKVITRFTSKFRGMGIQFDIPLDESQYMALKPYDDKENDFQFALIRDFRVTGGEGNRNTLDTWRLENPQPLVRKTRPAPGGESSK